MPTVPTTTYAKPDAAAAAEAIKAAGSKTAAAGGQQSLGKDDFLKLFVTQLQHQDPLNPMDDAAQMAQMAQFSTLEQTSNIATGTSSLVAAAGMSQSLGLIGKTVTYVGADGAERSGVVAKVTTQAGTTTLTVGDATGINPSAVTSVTAAPTSQEPPA